MKEVIKREIFENESLMAIRIAIDDYAKVLRWTTTDEGIVYKIMSVKQGCFEFEKSCRLK